MTDPMDSVDILVVEDNPDDVTLTLRALSQHNLANSVHVARDGAEALEYLRVSAVPKVMLLDLKLPKITGLEVLAAVRAEARLRTMPVVVLTSSREEPDIERAYALGVNSYIVKPVEFGHFVRAVSEAGLYWLILNQPPRS